MRFTSVVVSPDVYTSMPRNPINRPYLPLSENHINSRLFLTETPYRSEEARYGGDLTIRENKRKCVNYKDVLHIFNTLPTSPTPRKRVVLDTKFVESVCSTIE